MAKNKTKKRQEGASLAGQIQQAANGGAWNRNPNGPSNPPVNKKLSKLEDDQVLKRLGNKRPDVKGDRRQLQKLKAQVRAPQTRNLVPGADGQMVGAGSEARTQAKAQLQKLRQGLSGFRGLRQEAARRKIGPFQKGNEKMRGQASAPARPPVRPLNPQMGTPAPVPPAAQPAQANLGGAPVPNTRNPNAPGYVRGPQRPHRRPRPRVR